MWCRLAELAVLFSCTAALAACGGGHGGGSATSSAPTPAAPAPVLSNFATLTVDSGPATLQAGPNGYDAFNIAYVSVTLCAPNTNTCQTIDHVQVDTGSVGLRIPASFLNPSLLSALPQQTDPAGDPVGECYGYVDGYAFGAVRQADFQIGGEKVSAMPLQVIGDSGVPAAVPSSCSSGGGSNLDTVQALGANGVIGLGTTPTDCGTACTTAGGYAAAIYYDCPSTGCSTIIARAASTTAPFQQVPNPVAAMAVDNNGVIVSLPAPAASGSASVSGTLYFGIGTQTNNGLGSATVLTSTASTDPRGGGLITAIYKGQTLSDSFIDSGSTTYLFADSSIPLCTATGFTGEYCPPSPLTLTATLQGANAMSSSPSFPLYNAQTLLSGSNAAVPGIGGNPTSLGLTNDYPSSFDFGLPFFYGRNIYTAIEGRMAAGTVGPYYAF